MLDGTRIAIVDDDPDVLEVLAEILEAFGAAVVMAGSADAARELLLGERPDVLLSDIGMAGGDGYSLIRWLRAHERERELPATPAVAMTGLAEFADPAASLRAGFHAHLVKPIDAEVLAEIVGALAAGRAAASR